MAKLPASVTIGEFSARSGVAASALRWTRRKASSRLNAHRDANAATPATCSAGWPSSEPHNGSG